VNKNGSNINFGYDGNGKACPPAGVITTIGAGYSITNSVYDWRNLPTAITKSGTPLKLPPLPFGNRDEEVGRVSSCSPSGLMQAQLAELISSYLKFTFIKIFIHNYLGDFISICFLL
jgi:hypothetical protein